MRLLRCLSISVFLHMLCIYYTFCMLIKIIEPTSVLFAKNNWFLFVISSRINKKLFVAKTKLVNNLICLKDGCLSSHSHFRLLLRGGYKRRGVQTIAGFLHRGNTGVWIRKSAAHSDCELYVQCCLLWFVSELPVRLLS